MYVIIKVGIVKEFTMEKLFEHILDDDEKIVKVFKPHKTKLFLSSLLLSAVSLIFFVVFAVIAILFPEDKFVSANAVYTLIPIGIFVIILGLIAILIAIYYKNIYYAYSNKRIIIRSGIFGVDYKSLDMSMIGAVNVSVSLLDKILKKNTGSISFGSTASPVVSSKTSAYNFTHITLPYETCKEVKSYIDAYKKEMNKK